MYISSYINKTDNYIILLNLITDFTGIIIMVITCISFSCPLISTCIIEFGHYSNERFFLFISVLIFILGKIIKKIDEKSSE